MTDQSIFETMLTRVRGHQLAALIQLAARWDLADRIGEGKHVAELARELQAHAGALRRFVRALAAFDIFRLDDDDFATQTEASRFLMTNAAPSLHCAAKFWSIPAAWHAWMGLEHAVRNNACAFEHRFMQPMFDYLEAHPQQSAHFQAFMSASPDGRHTAVVEALDFARFRRVTDVGGGNGMQLAAILSACQDVSGMLYERASVLEGAAPSLLALARAGRCELMAGDFFDRIPEGADAYLLSQIVHDWSDASALRILRNCRKATAPGARLLLIERLLDQQSTDVCGNSFLSDIEMLVLHGAAERSIDEYRALLQEGGFCIERIVPTKSPFSIIECTPQ